MRVLKVIRGIVMVTASAFTIIVVIVALLANWSPRGNIHKRVGWTTANYYIEWGCDYDCREYWLERTLECDIYFEAKVTNPGMANLPLAGPYRCEVGSPDFGIVVDYESGISPPIRIAGRFFTVMQPRGGGFKSLPVVPRPTPPLPSVLRRISLHCSAIYSVDLAKLSLIGLGVFWLLVHRHKFERYLPGFPVVMPESGKAEADAIT